MQITPLSGTENEIYFRRCTPLFEKESVVKRFKIAFHNPKIKDKFFEELFKQIWVKKIKDST